jgi:hypothetical protein
MYSHVVSGLLWPLGSSVFLKLEHLSCESSLFSGVTDFVIVFSSGRKCELGYVLLPNPECLCTSHINRTGQRMDHLAPLVILIFHGWPNCLNMSPGI